MASHLLDMCCTIGDTLPALVSFLKERRLRNYPYDFVTNAIIPIREECQLLFGRPECVSMGQGNETSR
jgi:hypothetical protein